MGRARGGRCVARATGPGPAMGRCQRDKSGAGGLARRPRRGEERVRGRRMTAAATSRGPRRVRAGRIEVPVRGAGRVVNRRQLGCAAGDGRGGCGRSSRCQGRGRAAAALPILSAAPRGRPDVRPPALPKEDAERCPAVRAARAAVGVGKAVVARVWAARGRGSGPPSRAVTCVPAVSSRQGSNESFCGYSTVM